MLKQTFKCLLVVALAAAAGVARAEVTVTEAWVRGMVPGQSATGAFMTIHSTQPTTLIGASTPMASRVEIHRMTVDQGMMRMRPVEGVPVPENGSVRLEPGGYHVMLMGVTKPLAKGEKIPLELTFKDKDGKQSTTRIEADVRDLAGHGGMKMNMK
jgi:copper(I)-binding protein